jgi:predicted enzyme related to lactoylglutathione lyase
MGDTPEKPDTDRPAAGSIAWRDLTVPDAEALRDFYSLVVGWQAAPVEMQGYSDFIMMPPGSADPVAGICHTRGSNADLPPQWLLYIVVENVDRSAASCVALGGAVVAAPRPLSGGRFCVIRDPAGAVCALYEPGS